MAEKQILDPACGGRMFYFDKHDPRVLFGDSRTFSGKLCDGLLYIGGSRGELPAAPENLATVIKGKKIAFESPRDAFAALINRISPKLFGLPIWDANPLVYVYSFKLID